MEALQPLCNSADLKEGGEAVVFELCYAGQTCRAFAVRFDGQPHAYLNRCSHRAMELDGQAGRFFDESGRWLICSSHDAAYRPDTGDCAGGPCRGPLVKIDLAERAGVIYWQVAYNFRPVLFR